MSGKEGMDVCEALEALRGCLLVDAGTTGLPVRNYVNSDMMSEVLLAQEEDLLILTGLNSEHVVRTAHVLGAHAVVFLDGRQPGPGVLQAGRDLEVNLGVSPLDRKSAAQILARAFSVNSP